jgi:hypothetical protein
MSSCAQVNVVNGGSGSPGPLVSFPGAYTGVSAVSLSHAFDRSALPVFSTSRAS